MTPEPPGGQALLHIESVKGLIPTQWSHCPVGPLALVPLLWGDGQITAAVTFWIGYSRQRIHVKAHSSVTDPSNQCPSPFPTWASQSAWHLQLRALPWVSCSHNLLPSASCSVPVSAYRERVGKPCPGGLLWAPTSLPWVPVLRLDQPLWSYDSRMPSAMTVRALQGRSHS